MRQNTFLYMKMHYGAVPQISQIHVVYVFAPNPYYILLSNEEKVPLFFNSVGEHVLRGIEVTSKRSRGQTQNEDLPQKDFL